MLNKVEKNPGQFLTSATRLHILVFTCASTPIHTYVHIHVNTRAHSSHMHVPKKKIREIYLLDVWRRRR